MGRIDEALRRSNIDVGRGTGGSMPAPAPSAWQFGQQPGGDDAPEPAGPRPSAPVAEVSDRPVTKAPADRAVPEEDGPPARWDGFDAGALERLVVSKTAGPLLVEQFRSLAATLHRAQAEQPIKSVIVTSASPGDGKSYVAANLALTLSDSYRRRVLLIDADLRRPSLHTLFGASNARGLCEALKAKADEKVATIEIGETLTLLPAGQSEANPLGALSSERMKRIVEEAGSRFDWVIVDSPPVGLLADARLVAETVDAAIVVVRAGVTRFHDLEAAADTLGHERILGIVLNAVEPAEIRGGGYYRDYYRSEPEKS
jgi:capsular exopolysaccharide synthesis family protein